MSNAYSSDDVGGAGELSLGDKVLRLNWVIVTLLIAAAGVGFFMLYSVAGGNMDPWARAQMARFALGFGVMLLVAFIDVRVWLDLALPFYLGALFLLLLVEVMGARAMGATRWLRFGGIQVQPSELMKPAIILLLAAMYHRLEPGRRSRPFWLFVALLIAAIPAALTIRQPDLGTALVMLAGAVAVMFLAGVDGRIFAGGALLAAGGVWLAFLSRGTDWQLLKDYQYRRIDSFLNPEGDALGGAYHVIQSKIAIGSGGLEGKGFLQGSQTHLSFLPEPHTDFIFTTLAEEYGFRGGVALLALYTAVTLAAALASASVRSDFGRLVAGGVAASFFILYAVNIAMVTGLAPVVGVPLPLVSYGGTSMLMLLFSFGLLLSAEIHGRDPIR